MRRGAPTLISAVVAAAEQGRHSARRTSPLRERLIKDDRDQLGRHSLALSSRGRGCRPLSANSPFRAIVAIPGVDAPGAAGS